MKIDRLRPICGYFSAPFLCFSICYCGPTPDLDYRELVRLLEEGSHHETGEESPLPEGKPSVPEGENLELQQIAREIQQLQGTVNTIQEDVRSVGGHIGNQIAKIETRLTSELESVARRIEDTKKDIKNKISYTVGRLKV